MSGRNFCICLNGPVEAPVYTINFETKDGVDKFCEWLLEVARRYGSGSGRETAEELADAIWSGRVADRNSVVLSPHNLASLVVFFAAMLDAAHSSDLQNEALLDKYMLILSMYQDGPGMQSGGRGQGYIS